MELDIQYLLLLQELRNITGGIFDELFNAISKIAVDVMPFLPFLIFWAVDKKWGYRFLYAHSVSEVLNGVIKLTVCAYRPWIRSSQIEPAGDAKTAATGYSFPSGHTMSCTSTYGSVFAWQRERRKWLAILCVVAIFLTGFSRNFLGVHTPQDVVVGFFAGAFTVYIVGRLFQKFSGNNDLLDRLTIFGLIIVILIIVYITFKSYPMDYVDGVLLVDPQKMMNDCFKGCGEFTGLLLGSYLERHYIEYEIPYGSSSLPTFTCVGIGILFSWKKYLAPATIVAAFGGHWGNFITRCIMMIFAVYIWPKVIMKSVRA